ncbi:MAG: O-acetyl-ADP-ribose deacetylase [Methanomicrobiales archaeon]|nr:O-acetyl-ADP-ribose deacetylase [Methanomicrobiales archaeon]
MTGKEPGSGPLRARLMVVEGDIAEQVVDAIVNPANPTLLGGGGADGAIHRAAGPGLREECGALGGCRTGEAKITGGHRLPARFVIHTVGPIWRGGGEGEDDLLAESYRSSLRLAGERGLTSIAFPSISTGAYGFPFLRAARIAVGTILDTLPETPSIQLVVFVCHGEEAAAIYRKVLSGISRMESPAGGTGPSTPEGALVEQILRDRIRAHLLTIERAYGIRISNITEVMDRIAAATGDDREILSIATAISSFVAMNLRPPEMEIPARFLDQTIGRLVRGGRKPGDGEDRSGIDPPG